MNTKIHNTFSDNVRSRSLSVHTIYFRRFAIALALFSFMSTIGTFFVAGTVDVLSSSNWIATSLLVSVIVVIFTASLILTTILATNFAKDFVPMITKRPLIVKLLPLTAVILSVSCMVIAYRLPTVGQAMGYTFVLLLLIAFTLSAILFRSQKIVYALLTIFVPSALFISVYSLIGSGLFAIVFYWFPVSVILYLQRDLLQARPRLLKVIVRWGTVLLVCVSLIQLILALPFISTLSGLTTFWDGSGSNISSFVVFSMLLNMFSIVSLRLTLIQQLAQFIHVVALMGLVATVFGGLWVILLAYSHSGDRFAWSVTGWVLLGLVVLATILEISPILNLFRKFFAKISMTISTSVL